MKEGTVCRIIINGFEKSILLYTQPYNGDSCASYSITDSAIVVVLSEYEDNNEKCILHPVYGAVYLSSRSLVVIE